MRISLFPFLLLLLFFNQCSTDNGPASKLNAEQASIALQKELQPKLVGKWILRQVNLKYQDYNAGQKQLKISRDTSFRDLALLTIIPTTQPRSSPRDWRVGEYDGTFQLGGKAYPIQFDLLAYSDWMYRKKGPQGVFLLMYNFPIGIRISEAEETYFGEYWIVWR